MVLSQSCRREARMRSIEPRYSGKEIDALATEPRSAQSSHKAGLCGGLCRERHDGAGGRLWRLSSERRPLFTRGIPFDAARRLSADKQRGFLCLVVLLLCRFPFVEFCSPEDGGESRLAHGRRGICPRRCWDRGLSPSWGEQALNMAPGGAGYSCSVCAVGVVAFGHRPQLSVSDVGCHLLSEVVVRWRN